MSSSYILLFNPTTQPCTHIIKYSVDIHDSKYMKSIDKLYLAGTPRTEIDKKTAKVQHKRAINGYIVETLVMNPRKNAQGVDRKRNLGRAIG